MKTSFPQRTAAWRTAALPLTVQEGALCRAAETTRSSKQFTCGKI